MILLPYIYLQKNLKRFRMMVIPKASKYRILQMNNIQVNCSSHKEADIFEKQFVFTVHMYSQVKDS